MKNYAIITKDLSVLKEQVTDYLVNVKNSESPGYIKQLYHPIGQAESLINQIPAIGSEFTDINLTVKRLGHYNIDDEPRPTIVTVPMLVVPLKDTENCTMHINEPKIDELPYVDYLGNHFYYDNSQCNVLESFSIASNQAVFLPKDVHWSVSNTGLNLAQFILISFNEDLSSYFAE